MVVSDIVLEEPLPDTLRGFIEAYTGCISGAVSLDQYVKLLRQAGFDNVEIIQKTRFGPISSAKLKATKPKTKTKNQHQHQKTQKNRCTS